jgi:hypothetical protein
VWQPPWAGITSAVRLITDIAAPSKSDSEAAVGFTSSTALVAADFCVDTLGVP